MATIFRGAKLPPAELVVTETLKVPDVWANKIPEVKQIKTNANQCLYNIILLRSYIDFLSNFNGIYEIDYVYEKLVWCSDME